MKERKDKKWCQRNLTSDKSSRGVKGTITCSSVDFLIFKILKTNVEVIKGYELRKGSTKSTYEGGDK